MKTKTPERDRAIALGLYLSGATCPIGHRRTDEEIAAFVNAAGAKISRQRIQQIGDRALRRLRAKLYRKEPVMVALIESLNDESTPTEITA